jgi:hypothetical protein
MTSQQLVIAELLKLLPALRSGYAAMSLEFAEGLTDEDVASIQEIQQMHNLEGNDPKAVGSTIVFENLLMPHIAALADAGDFSEVSRIMNWIETLSRSEVFNISNLVAVTICESLITSFSDKLLPQVYPYMGEKTKSLCIMQFPAYKISDEVKKLFSS